MKIVALSLKISVLYLILGLFLNATFSHLTTPPNVTAHPFRADSTQLDPESGLIVDTQLTLVKAQCTACHSARIIRHSHFSREKWMERIRWMQRTQNLWDLGESEPAVLTYLAKHYGPVAQTFDGRREPLKKVQWYWNE
jgi:hypothetical protein